MGIVHAANCTTLLPWFPLPFLILPNEFGRKVLVEELLCVRILGIGFEVGGESGIPVSLFLNHGLYILGIVFIPCGKLLVREMDLKSDNVGALLTHQELI